MTRKIQHKRGLEANLPQLDVAEIAFTTDSKKPFIGSADGNVEIAKKADVDAKASKTELTNAVSPKADKTYVDTELGKKASTDEVSAVSAQLADTTDYAMKNQPTTLRRGVKRPMVTFVDDDGYDDTYERFFPLFNSKRVPLTAAVITSYLNDDKGRYMTKDQVRELIAAGWEIIGHTHNAHTPNMTALTEEQLVLDVQECRRQLNLLGSNSRGFAYPQGATNSIITRELQKYFDFAFAGDGGVHLPGGDLDVMQIGRKEFGWNSSYTLTDMKSFVDAAEASNGWLVVMLHSEPTTEAQLTELGELIDYIQSKNIEIVNASEGYEVYGSKLYIGDKREKYINITDEGIFGNVDLKLTGNMPVKKTTWNGKVPSDGINTFESDMISVTQISNTHGNQNGFPENKGGMLLTYKYDVGIPGYSKQEYHIYNSLDIYTRYATSDTTWSDWKKQTADPAQKETEFRFNVATNTMLPQDFTKKITLDALSQAHTVASGFPTTDAGVLTTMIADDGKVYAYQELRDRTNKVFVRTGISNVWTAWKELPGTIVIKSGNISSASLTFNDIPPNTTVTQNVTLPGVALGRRIIVNPNNTLPEGIMFSAWISAADTLTVRIANISSTTQSATTNWNYTVI